MLRRPRHLDSLAVDHHGDICITSLGSASGVTVISPDGAPRRVVAVPEHDEFVTNICFGGLGGTTAYITSSQLGRLYAVDWP